jgi:hypothetical protein
MLGINLEVDWAPILDAVAGQQVSLFRLCIVPGSLGWFDFSCGFSSLQHFDIYFFVCQQRPLGQLNSE